MVGWSRRAFLMSSSAALVMPVRNAAAAPLAEVQRETTGPTGSATWLDSAPPDRHEGVTWGQPWPRGTHLARDYRLAAGEALQSWPLAWWPDGSIKWTGHAVAADAARAEGLRVEAGRGRASASMVQVSETPDALTVIVGDTVWTVGRHGAAIIRQATTGGSVVMRNVALTATALDRSEDDGEDPARLLRYAGQI